MKNLVDILARSLVDKPEKVEVNQVDGEKSIILELRVDSDDMGKVIGKQGKIAKAMRTVIKAAAAKDGKRVVRGDSQIVVKYNRDSRRLKQLEQPNETNSKMITIGQIGTAQGIQGEVRVIPLTDFPERFNQLTEDRDQALLYRNALIQIPESQLMPLPKGHYYLFQIVGLAVYLETGQYLGRVRDVLRTGSNDVYQVVDDNQHEFLVPALREVVAQINLEEQKMVIRPMPGLLEL